jgi:hypothetical protein
MHEEVRREGTCFPQWSPGIAQRPSDRPLKISPLEPEFSRNVDGGNCYEEEQIIVTLQELKFIDAACGLLNRDV